MTSWTDGTPGPFRQNAFASVTWLVPSFWRHDGVPANQASESGASDKLALGQDYGTYRIGKAREKIGSIAFFLDIIQKGTDFSAFPCPRVGKPFSTHCV